MKLCIGVVDIPEPLSNASTYEVANILEDKYGLFTSFYEKTQDQIAGYLEQAVTNAINDYEKFGNLNLKGALEGAGDLIAEDFKRMIGEQQFNDLPGVPTKAAMLGKSRRLKNGGKGNFVSIKSARPSFEDTGTFEKSISAWVQE